MADTSAEDSRWDREYAMDRGLGERLADEEARVEVPARARAAAAALAVMIEVLGAVQETHPCVRDRGHLVVEMTCNIRRWCLHHEDTTASPHERQSAPPAFATAGAW